MSRSCSIRRIPRGFIDPIESRADALAVLSLAAPFGDDTVAILLDPERRGIGIVVVTGTTRSRCNLPGDRPLHPGSVHRTSPASSWPRARPGGDMQAVDRERWIEAAMQCDDAGIELVEWFVIGDAHRLPSRPRRRACSLERTMRSPLVIAV